MKLVNEKLRHGSFVFNVCSVPLANIRIKARQEIVQELYDLFYGFESFNIVKWIVVDEIYLLNKSS